LFLNKYFCALREAREQIARSLFKCQRTKPIVKRNSKHCFTREHSGKNMCARGTRCPP